MADKNPYGLRNADIENLDLSEFAKDFSADELAAVRAGLLQKRQQQQEQFNSLPVFDQAKIYAGEKFGEVKKAVEDNPELLLGVLAGKAALDVGSSAVQKTKSLYDRMINKPSDSLGAPTPQTAPQTTPAATTEIPSVEAAAQQAAQQAAAEGKIKTGKAGGSITPQEGAILEGETAGKVKAEVSDIVGKAGKAIKPNFDKPLFEDRAVKQAVKAEVKGISGAEKQYLNMLGYDSKNPTSAKSLQALQAWEQVKLEAFGGIPPKSKPTGGLPTMHPEYQRYVQSNVTNFPPEVQSQLGKNYSASAIREADKLIKEGVPLSKQAGMAPIEGMARTGLAALGAIPVVQKLSQGDFKGALNEAIPASAMIDPRISLALSPLYTSDEEIAILKKAEQGRKVGAGRGIAPPSAYMR